MRGVLNADSDSGDVATTFVISAEDVHVSRSAGDVATKPVRPRHKTEVHRNSRRLFDVLCRLQGSSETPGMAHS